MTAKEKELLLKDLCARLPYGVHLFTNSKHHIRLLTIIHDIDYDEQYWINGLYDVDEVKPYLRPMSSMTEEEYKELKKISDYYGLAPFEYIYDWGPNYEIMDWLNKHHFDYRGLIEKSLAIAVTEENNPYKE